MAQLAANNLNTPPTAETSKNPTFLVEAPELHDHLHSLNC